MAPFNRDDSDEYEEDNTRRTRSKSSRLKRRKINEETDLSVSAKKSNTSPLDPLIDTLEKRARSDAGGFEENITTLLPEFLRQRAETLSEGFEKDTTGAVLRPLTRAETNSFLEQGDTIGSKNEFPLGAITMRKLKVLKQQRHSSQTGGADAETHVDHTISPLSSSMSYEVDPQVISALYAIQTTPYQNSFLSRIQGSPYPSAPVIAVDWDSKPPWTNLIEDIGAHYAIRNPDTDHQVSAGAPIVYSALQEWHLRQIHDILERLFWSGIDVSDSLQFNPEKCTVVATFKRLVVGCAILSSPQETYITYLAVRAGWENAQIATSMLYHLISMNPNKDITLHVSVNNPAMLLYNRFGFKAEEFIVGFYQDYLDPQSRASKNAFRLRLRR